MRAVRVILKDAQAAKEFLKGGGFLQAGALPFREGGFFFIPVSKLPRKAPFEFAVLEREFKISERKPFKQLLSETGLLSRGELESLVTSFDVFGDIAVIEIPPSLRGKEQEIGRVLLKSLAQGGVKTVAKRAGITKGRFRVRKIRVLAGEEKSETIHAENGCRYNLDLNEVYFSQRLGFERARVASLVKPGERVLVLFAGVGPFAINIARVQPRAQVVAVELNPSGVKYMRKNVKLNRTPNVKPVRADAAKFLLLKKWAGWADRVVMPLPKKAGRFLTKAVKAAAPGCTIHFYSLASEKENDLFSSAVRTAREACAKAGRQCRVLDARRVKPYAPYVSQVVLDFKVV